MTASDQTMHTRIIEWLNNRAPGMECPVCHANEWSLYEAAFELREYRDGNLVVGGPLMPVVPVSCKNCAYTMLFNAIQMGVVEPSTKAPSEEGSND